MAQVQLGDIVGTLSPPSTHQYTPYYLLPGPLLLRGHDNHHIARLASYLSPVTMLCAWIQSNNVTAYINITSIKIFIIVGSPQ